MDTIYGKEYYENYDMGDQAVSYLECTELRKFHARVARELTAHFHPETMLDAGCAMGVLVSEFTKQGVRAYGLDFSEYAVSHADPAVRDRCYCGSLAEPFPAELPAHFDLVTCMEVLEHMSVEDGHKAVANLCKVTDTVLFCSSPDDFEDPTHINVQEREYWAALFAENGFYDDLSYRPMFMTDYAVCYRRMKDWRQPLETYERHIRQTDGALRDFRDSHYLALEREHEKAVSEWTRTSRELEASNENCARLKDVCEDKNAQLVEALRKYQELLEEQTREHEQTAAAWRKIARELEQVGSFDLQLEQASSAWLKITRELERVNGVNLQLEQTAEAWLKASRELEQTNEARLQLEQICRDREQQLCGLRAEYARCTQAHQAACASLNRVSLELAEIRSSTSWKLTKPLRWASLKTKHLIGRSARRMYHALRHCLDSRLKPVPNAVTNWPPRISGNSSSTRAEAVPELCRRLAIYTIYDQNGVVDEYVLYYLKALSRFVEKTVVVSNGPLQDAGKAQLEALNCQVMIRQNSGFDAWGVKCGLEAVGFQKLGDYDEVVISNNTLFGPVVDMQKMFAEMSAKKLDFWGICSHPGWQDMDPFHCNPYGHIPEHVQSFFYVVRRRMLTSKAFSRFWTELPELPTYSEAVGLYETVMTRYFADAGYTWATYMKSEDYYDMTDNPLISMPVEALRDFHCPFFKRRAFFQDYDYLTTFTGLQSASYLMQYLQEDTEYPVELVWKNLIRTCHMSDLAQNMHLVRVFDRDSYFEPAVHASLRSALFMHIYDSAMAPELCRYAAQLPPETDIYISTVSPEKRDAIRDEFSSLPNQVEIRVLPNRGRDVSALLTSFRDVVMDYDVACVTHDKKTGYLKPQTVGEGFAYMGYENILASRAFTEQVLEAFEQDPFLGLLCAPDPNHADFATHVGLEWGQNWSCTRRLAEELKLHVPMDEKHPPMAPFGSSFWFRTAAMKPLFDKQWTYDDFPQEPFDMKDGSILHAIERIYPYVVQHMGFYSAMLMTADYAAVDLANLAYYSQQYAQTCFENGIANRFPVVRDQCRACLSPREAAGAGEEEKPVRFARLRALLNRWADCE